MRLAQENSNLAASQLSSSVRHHTKVASHKNQEPHAKSILHCRITHMPGIDVV
jgi:hypothetical protein